MQTTWLHAVSWDSILTTNKSLCETQKVEHKTEPKAIEKVQKLWETAGARNTSLKEALDLCRQCYELNGFVYNNGNTFATVGRNILEVHLKSLAPVDAQIVRTTVSHYVVGLIGRRELLDILKHYQSVWQSATRPPEKVQPPQPVSVPALTEARTHA